MKRIKRFASLAMAMIMALAMTVTAFAATGTYKITINNDATGHQYEAYQIFAGTLYVDPENSNEDTNKTLSDIVWGDGVSEAGKTALGADAAAVAEDLQTGGSAAAAAFAQQFAANPTYLAATSGTLTGPTDGKYVIDGLAPGYYLVKDKDGSLTANDNYTTFILEVVGDAEATPKNTGTPEPDKSVKDKNDSTGDASDWQQSADYDIGDEIEYELKATLPTTVSAYNTYKLVFHDNLSAGLDYVDGSAVVKLNGNAITTGYTVAYANKELTVTFTDVKTAGATNGDVITVEYKAKLNAQAVIGKPGNLNTLTLEYSNNPNNVGEGKPDTGTTPPVTAVVFTFKTTVNKVQPGDTEGTTKPLVGAEFTLEKYDAEAEEWKTVKAYTVEDGELNKFEFSGLDDGRYRLTETKTPAGFNSIDPIYFEIVATHTEEDGTGNALTNLQVNETDENGTVITENKKADFTITADFDNAVTDVLNQSGSVLPSTGGIGTTIFYVVGGILVVAAGILLVTKKRMSAR